MAARTLNITGDNTVELYLDGVASEINNATGWDNFKTAKSAKFPTSTTVLAVKVTSSGGPVGLLASASDNSLITDTNWVVSSTLATGWNTASFDDSKWAKAVSQGANGAATWGAISGPTISSTALWIADQDTTAYDGAKVSTLYFRRRLDRQLFITGDNQLTLYFDGVASAVNTATGWDDWTQTKSTTLPGSTRVIAAQVVNVGGPCGLLASVTGDSLLTDEKWLVSGIPATGFQLPTFDDSKWTTAVSQGVNDATATTWSGARPNISAAAKWINNRDSRSDAPTVTNVMYYRRRLW